MSDFKTLEHEGRPAMSARTLAAKSWAWESVPDDGYNLIASENEDTLIIVPDDADRMADLRANIETEGLTWR